jgi:hypothetical protein
MPALPQNGIEVCVQTVALDMNYEVYINALIITLAPIAAMKLQDLEENDNV